MMAQPRIGVYAAIGDDDCGARANVLAARLRLPRTSDPRDAAFDVLLHVDAAGLAIATPSQPRRLVRADLGAIDTVSGPGRTHRQPLARALGLGRSLRRDAIVVDATAGLGGDSFLMASLGCRVIALERSTVVLALLADGLMRAASHGDRKPICIVHAEAREWLSSADDQSIDAVYLDPMFPPGRKTAEKKDMVLLREVVGDDADADSLLTAAMAVAAHRVIVKRPPHAPTLAGATPVHQHEGKGVRYDVYSTRLG